MTKLLARDPAGGSALVEVDAGVIPANVQSGTSYTLVAGDAGKEVQMSNAAANTVAVDASVMTVGAVVLIRQTGAGQTSITAASGTTITNGGPTRKAAKQGACMYVRVDSSSTAYVGGEVAAS